MDGLTLTHLYVSEHYMLHSMLSPYRFELSRTLADVDAGAERDHVNTAPMFLSLCVKYL